MKNQNTDRARRTWAPWLKTVAYLLSILLFLYAVPTNVFAELIEAIDTVTDSNDEQTTVEETESGKEGTVFEVIDRREETVKHFRTEDGSFTAIQYNVPVHEKDENGEWQDIDNTLSELGSEYATPNAKIKFTKKIPGNEGIFTLHDGNRKITMSLSGANKKVAGQVTNTQTEFPEDATQLQKMMTLDKLSSKILYPEILDGVDLEYVVNSCNIKENIIVKERADSYSYTFEIKLNNLEAVLCEDGSVAISDPDTDEVVYTIPKGYMFDADGEYSDAVEYTLTNGGNGKYSLTVAANAEWINDEGRAFPVTIDPPITVNSNSQMTDTYIDSANLITTYYNATSLKVGRTASDITSVSLWKLNEMPSIPANAYIVSAELSLKLTSISAYYSDKIGAYTVTTDWTTNYAYSWSVADLTTLCAESRLIDFADMYNVTAGSTVTWDITSAFRTWYSNDSVSNGIALAPITPYAMSAVFASANTTTSVQPQLVVEYRDMKGIESYWSGSSHSAGLAGSGFVNHASGNLVFVLPLVGTGDALFGYTPSLVYNSAIANYYNTNNNNQNIPYKRPSSAYGWKLNTDDSLVAKTYYDATGIPQTSYVWADGDGTEHYFLPAGQSSTWTDEDGLGLTLTTESTNQKVVVEDLNGTQYQYAIIQETADLSAGGILECIRDPYGNKLLFYNNDHGHPESISLLPHGSEENAIQYLSLSYNSLGYLCSIKNNVTNQAMAFEFGTGFVNSTLVSPTATGPLCQVTYGHMSGDELVPSAVISYSYTNEAGNSPGSIYRLFSAKDNNSGTELRYTYNTAGQVETVTEYGRTEEGEIIQGQSIRYTYGTGYTEVRSSGSDDILQTDADSDDIITHYALDYQGRAVSAYSTNAARTAMYGATNNDYEYRESAFGSGTGDSGNTKNRLKASAITNGVSINYLYNGGFEVGSDENVIGWVTTSTGARIHSDLISLNQILNIPVSTEGTTSIYQDVLLSSGTYTLSADCFPHEAGAKITLKAETGTEVLGTNTYTLYDVVSEANRLSPTLSFTVRYDQTVRVIIEVEGDGSGSNYVYIDNVMLENNIGAGSFNMVQFGGFSDTYADSNTAASPTSYWSANTNAMSIVSQGLQGSGLKIEGDVNEERWVKQGIYVTAPSLLEHVEDASIGSALRRSRTFTLSGFANATAQIANKEASFGLQAEIYYYDSSVPETVYFEFNKELTEWQFLSGTFTTAPGKIVQYIDIKLTYAYQPNEVCFDNISLIEEKGNNAANYMYNDEGLLEFTYTPADCAYYEYDANHNLIFAYDSQGNGYYSQYNGKVLVSETTFKYEFPDANMNLLDWYLNDGVPDRTNLVDELTCNVISKTVYSINTYGLNTATVSYSATGTVRSATQKTGTTKLTSSTTYNLTEGSPLFGRVMSTTDTAGNITRYVYDSQARLSYEYREDNQGLYYIYDVLGRLTSVTPLMYSASVNSFCGQTGAERADYTYDPQTLRLSQIATTTTTYAFTYDNFGNTTKIQAGDSVLVEYEYNDYNGKLSAMKYGTDDSVTYSYDELDRVRAIAYKENGAIVQIFRYTYTATGAIHSVEEAAGGRLYLYNYDSKGQLIGYTECDGDSALVQNLYLYDEKDRIDYWHSAFNYTASNGNTYSDAVGYGYDYLDYDSSTHPTSVGELEEISILAAGLNNDIIISYDYDPFYRLDSKILTAPASWTITSEYGFYGTSTTTSALVSNFTSTVEVGSASTATSYSYTYDVDGNITQIVDGNGKKISYKYDDLGQLLRENNQILGKTYVYTYDNGGNRKSKKTYAYTTANSLSSLTYTEETYTYGNASWGDQLTKVNSVAISYDAIGNPTTFNGYDLTWHGRQLKQMSRNGGQSLLKFKYNADGIRTNKIVDGVNHVYTLNGTQIVSEAWGNYLLIYLYDESGAPIGLQYRTKSYAANVFDTFYFEKNLQGDIIAVYNASGEKIGSYTYDAWGVCTASVVSGNTVLENNVVRTLNPFRYRGYYYDTETGLYYLQSRYYNPAWGRFLNADGYVNANGDLIGFNMYAYCSNNPVMNIDPSGCAWYDWVSTIIGFFNPVSTIMAIGAVVSATFSGRWAEVEHDWRSGCLNPFNQSEDVALKSQVLSFYKGSTVVRHDTNGTCSIFGTIWLGNNKGSTSLKHEYGHCIQENLLGPIYLLNIVLPSALYWQYDRWTAGSELDYFSTPWERTADFLGGVSASERAEGYKRGSLAWGIVENIFGPNVIPAYFVFGH